MSCQVRVVVSLGHLDQLRCTVFPYTVKWFVAVMKYKGILYSALADNLLLWALGFVGETEIQGISS